MNSFQMRIAVFEIRSGKKFHESILPKTERSREQWEELYEEIRHGYSIDSLPREKIFQIKPVRQHDRA